MPPTGPMREEKVGDRIAVFTICAANYLPQASVLADSLAACHPGLRLKAFLLDTPPADAPVSAHLDLIRAAAVLDPATLVHKACFYDVLEFSTSIKPECFLHLLGDHDAVFYFDPDIRLLSPLPAIQAWPAGGVSAILTPHILTPLPDDGHHPDNLDILRSGEYNLGFAAFRRAPEVTAFLAWWGSALREMCLADISRGVFTDQKWVNFATSFLAGVQVDRDPGCNVAYWNLHEREPVQAGGAWHVRGAGGALHPIRFFHFSGYSPRRPALSRHEDRFVLRPPGETRTLLDQYGAALAAAGHAALHGLALDPPRFAQGPRWDPVCRAAYRGAVRAGLDLGNPLEGDRFLDWLAAPAPGDHANRYLRALMNLRGDVASAFDDGRNGLGLLRWVHGSGVAEMGIDLALLDRIGLGEDHPSVHYVGYLRAHLGVAEAARNSIAALREADVAVETHDISALTGNPLGAYDTAGAHRPVRNPPIAILGFNADVMPDVLPRLPARVADTWRIGCWYWETPDFPDAWCDRFDQVDEVWAATEYVARAIRAKATVPVAVMPPMVAPPAVAADRPWLRGLIPEIEEGEFLFLFQFDVASIPFRKNPEGTIAAFTRAFAPDEPVRLVIKLLNAQRDPALMDRLHGLAQGHRVSFFDAALDSLDRFRLLASIDCFVSLHRAEGFGLSLAESMAYGVPVVTTGWSGNADFTDAGNAAIVGWDLRPTGEAHGPYPAGAVWAEPRLDDAARQMRRIVDDPAWRAEIGAAGRQTVEARFSAAAVGAAMRGRILRLMASSRVRRPLRLPAAAPAAATGAMQHRPRLVQLALDVARYPGYYLSRLPRLPAMLHRHGVAGSVNRAFLVPQVAAPGHKRQFEFRGVLRGMLAALARRARLKRRGQGPA